MRAPASITELPGALPLFPLSGAVLLPGTRRPLNVFEPRFVAMVDDALASNRLIGMIQPRDDKQEAPKGNVPLETVGCAGRIVHFEEQAPERYFIVLEGLCRFEIDQELATATPYRQARVDFADYAEDFAPEQGAETIDRDRLVAVLKDYAEFTQIDVDWDEVENTPTDELINIATLLSPYGAREKQALLEAPTLRDRAETLIALAEVEMARAKAGAILQ